MKILLVATKPPWPPVDGGRVLMCETIAALAARGHRVTVVAPRFASVPATGAESGAADEIRLVGGRSMPFALAFLRALFSGSPTSVTRHSRPPVRREVECLLARESFDLVHAEQIQALPQAAPAFSRAMPVVVRAQNVESDLWAAIARRGGPLAPFARREARRLAAWEGRVVVRAAATVALTALDAGRLVELSRGGGRVTMVRAPFPPRLPSGERELPGEPAVVLLGSGGWPPNRDAALWFTDAIWPTVRAALPHARLHLFGQPSRRHLADGVLRRRAPADSRDVFPPGAILVVPLRIASGVRIKILEAWARGIPVVATPQAAAGLEVEDGRELLLASDAAAFTAALRRLADEPGLAARLTAAGRALLAERHDPNRIAQELEEVYVRAREAAIPGAVRSIAG